MLSRSQTLRMVTRHNNCNDTMLQRSAQLLLAAENELFEGGEPQDEEVQQVRHTWPAWPGEPDFGTPRIWIFQVSSLAPPGQPYAPHLCTSSSWSSPPSKSSISAVWRSCADRCSIVSLQLLCLVTIRIVWDQLSNSRDVLDPTQNFGPFA